VRGWGRDDLGTGARGRGARTRRALMSTTRSILPESSCCTATSWATRIAEWCKTCRLSALRPTRHPSGNRWIIHRTLLLRARHISISTTLIIIPLFTKIC